jgi:hypothetical protein
VFLYRFGVCHEIMAFKRRQFSLWRGPVPHRRHVKLAIQCFERAILIGERRPHLPQKCMTIRKTLADLLALSGRRWRAHRAWSLIRDLDPDCAEAHVKLASLPRPIRGLLPGKTMSDE